MRDSPAAATWVDARRALANLRMASIDPERSSNDALVEEKMMDGQLLGELAMSKLWIQ